MQAVGGVTATFHIAGISWERPVYVAPIRDTILLGIDFLEGVDDATILVRQGDLAFGEDLVTGKTSGERIVNDVVTANDERITPNSEKIIIGRVHHSSPQQTMVLDPSSLKNGLQVGSVLVKARDKIPVRILNLEDKPVTICRDTHIGKLKEVLIQNDVGDSIQEKGGPDNHSGKNFNESNIPPHLTKLYQQTRADLKTNGRKMV